MDYLYITLVVLCVVFCQMTSASEYARNCIPNKQYFNLEKGKCVRCTPCRDNQVPLRSCYGSQDTSCGTLNSFQFRQTEISNEEPISKTETEVTYKLPSAAEKNQQTDTTLILADEDNSDKWFTITMVLVGILVFTCVLGMVLLFVMCYVCKRKQREIVRDSGSYIYTSVLLKDERPINVSPPKMEQFKIITES